MDTPNNDQNKPVVHVYDAKNSMPAAGEPLAERFIHDELIDARKSLRMTQILSSIAALAVLIYTGVLTSQLNRTLEPTTAAQVATGLIVEQVETHGPEIATDLRQRLPQLIEGLPAYAKEQLPHYRTALEDQVEGDMNRYFTSSSKELGDTFDDLLSANKDSIQKMIKDGQDPAATQVLGNAIEKEMTDYVSTVSLNGETLATKLDGAYESLELLDKRMAKLASNENLTPQEKKARRAIGILSQNIETNSKGLSSGKTI